MTTTTNIDTERLKAFCLEILESQNRLPNQSECLPFLQSNPEELLETTSAYQHLKPLSEIVIASVFQKAKAGSIAHQKLWFQLVEQWATPKPKMPKEEETNNSISINLKPFTSQLTGNGN